MKLDSVFKKKEKTPQKEKTEQKVIKTELEPVKKKISDIVLTDEMNAAKEEILNTDTKLIWIFGKAGTGKSTFLDYMRNKEKLNNTVYLAPTGIAALIISGATIHSFFRIKPEDFYSPKPLDKELTRNLFPKLRKVERIVIDEISMVRADLLDEVDRRMRLANDVELPFGGVKVVFLGDAFQLPPVVTHKESIHFGKDKEYKSEYFFSSRVIRDNVKNMKHFQFSKVFRQDNIEFLNLLAKCRDATVTNEDLKLINENCVKSKDEIPENILRITTRKNEAQQINLKRYNAIENQEYTFKAKIKGESKFYENPENCPVPQELHMKVGTQILFVVNDKGKRFVNGTIAEITKIDEINEQITVKDSEGTFIVQPYIWSKIKYVIEDDELEEEVESSYIQYPFIYGWAMTIHRAQGRTLDKVFVDLSSGTFAPGQAYVALSRVKSIEGLYLRDKVWSTDFFGNEVVTKYFEYCKKNMLN